MPAMVELPPLPLEAVEGLEPALRIRHAITNTNYYVQVFSARRGAPASSGSRASTGKRSGAQPRRCALPFPRPPTICTGRAPRAWPAFRLPGLRARFYSV